jgi:hypothetical protein
MMRWRSSGKQPIQHTPALQKSVSTAFCRAEFVLRHGEGTGGRFRRYFSDIRTNIVSHIVSIQTEIRDPVAIKAACCRLSLPEPEFGETKLFSSAATGWAVLLPDWRYPVVCDVNTAKIAFDNFEGRWGNPKQLDRFLQGYAVEKARIEARRKGHSMTEQTLSDGSIKLTIQVGGAA